MMASASEEEGEDKYCHEVKLRTNDFKRFPGCIRIRRGAKPPYGHDDPCRKRMYDLIKNEEPERWRRHIVRRHVVSEEPQPEITVDAEDEEAPRDAWGFPAVAAKLDEFGSACARAPYSLTDRVPPDDSELVKRLLNVDVVEAFSPPRVTLEARKFGLKPGTPGILPRGGTSTTKSTGIERRSTLIQRNR